MAKIKLPGCPPPPLLYRKKRSKAKTGKLPQKAQLFAVLCLCKEKRSFFDKPRLQRLPKRSSVPQKTGKLSQKATLFATFVSLQGKTLFIWQIKVAKTAKAKLCATKKRHNYPKNSAQAEFLSFVPLQRKTQFL